MRGVFRARDEKAHRRAEAQCFLGRDCQAKALAYLEANVSSNYSGTTIQDLSGLNSVVAVAVSVVVLPRSFW